MKSKTSFGKYFDDQRDRIVSDMQTGKNTELYNAWREDYDERERKKQEERMKKELDNCSEKGVEISQECKDYYRKKFASLSIAKSMMEKNDETEKNSENT